MTFLHMLSTDYGKSMLGRDTIGEENTNLGGLMMFL